jgi:hypothetical protein
MFKRLFWSNFNRFFNLNFYFYLLFQFFRQRSRRTLRRSCRWPRTWPRWDWSVTSTRTSKPCAGGSHPGAGVDVVITMFCHFWLFSAKKLPLFTMTNVTIKFLHYLALFWVKNADFCGKNIFLNHYIGPMARLLYWSKLFAWRHAIIFGVKFKPVKKCSGKCHSPDVMDFFWEIIKNLLTS